LLTFEYNRLTIEVRSTTRSSVISERARNDARRNFL
jgi:hypothetical protein